MCNSYKICRCHRRSWVGNVERATVSLSANEGMKQRGIKVRSLSVFKITKETNNSIRII